MTGKQPEPRLSLLSFKNLKTNNYNNSRYLHFCLKNIEFIAFFHYLISLCIFSVIICFSAKKCMKYVSKNSDNKNKRMIEKKRVFCGFAVKPTIF